MSLLDDIKNALAPFLPFAQAVVLFMLPIYIAVGGAFAVAGLVVVGWLPTNNLATGVILMVVFVFLGVLLGILYDPERKEKAEEGKSAREVSEPVNAKSEMQEADELFKTP